MIELQARAKDILYEPCEAPSTLQFVADRAKTEQILINLLSNAMKFTAAGGSIKVTCALNAQKVEISVHDTGLGIPDDQLQAIFEPFVQVGRTLTTTREGVGLGLAISRDLARAMHGEISVVSTLGAGSVFTLSLPAA
jgi:signal transduction histidine kinase